MFDNSIMFVIKHEPVSKGLSASFTSIACSTSKKKKPDLMSPLAGW